MLRHKVRSLAFAILQRIFGTVWKVFNALCCVHCSNRVNVLGVCSNQSVFFELYITECEIDLIVGPQWSLKISFLSNVHLCCEYRFFLVSLIWNCLTINDNSSFVDALP